MINNIKNTFKSKAVKDMVKQKIEIYGGAEALRLQGEAARNRPWKDDTGDARKSIKGKFEWKGSQAMIVLSGGGGNVDYFQYLELAREKQYAILIPTIEVHATTILQGYKELLK